MMSAQQKRSNLHANHPEEQCKATTQQGERCQNKAGSSGYCHTHDPELLASREAAENARKKEVETEMRRRQQKRTQLEEVVSYLRVLLDELSTQTEKRGLLQSVVSGLYLEIQMLAKKAPSETITDLALENINRVISDTKELMQDDPYIQTLEVFIPAGDLPELRDALIVLGQIIKGLERFSVDKRRNEIRSRLELAQLLKRALALAIDGANSSNIYRSLSKGDGLLVTKIPGEWTVESGHGDKSFDLARLDALDVQAFFQLEE